MEIEKIFKNLILADFIVIILMVISSMYQPSEISNLNENLDDGLLSVSYTHLTLPTMLWV